MQIRIFHVSNLYGGDALADLNRFLSSNRILDVQQECIQNNNGFFWSFCVRFLTNQRTDKTNGMTSTKEKIDYREILTPEEFVKFEKLRAIRKKLADADATQAYNVFTNDELSNIARLNEITEKSLLAINGIGEKKVERYGKHIIEQMSIVENPIV